MGHSLVLHGRSQCTAAVGLGVFRHAGRLQPDDRGQPGAIAAVHDRQLCRLGQHGSRVRTLGRCGVSRGPTGLGCLDDRDPLPTILAVPGETNGRCHFMARRYLAIAVEDGRVWNCGLPGFQSVHPRDVSVPWICRRRPDGDDMDDPDRPGIRRICLGSGASPPVRNAGVAS